MTRRLFDTITIILLAILSVTMCGCKGCSDGKSKYYNPRVVELDETPDSALYVMLDSVSRDSMYVRISGQSVRKVYGINEAYAEGKVKGSLTPGDMLSIFPDNKAKRILISINVSEMSGQWFYDMLDHRGFSFGPNGALSTINNVEISFREWMLLNGKLYLYFVPMQQASIEHVENQVEEAEIKSLTKDQLIMDFRGATLNCRRQTKPLKFK